MDIDKSNDEFESQTKLAKEGIEDLRLIELQQVIGGEVCITPKRRLCQHPDGCNNLRVSGGVCLHHGAKVPLCSYEGDAPCTKQAKKNRLCTAHWHVRRKLMDIKENVYDTNGEDLSLIESPPLQEQAKTHLRPTKTAEEMLPKGVTFRPSGKWQVQLFYAGQSRYLGLFHSKEAAALAYALARDCVIQLGDDWRTWKSLTAEQIKANVITIRKAADGALMTADNTQQQAIRVHHNIVPKKSEEKAPVDDAFLLLYFASRG